jgi:hypothetical protein
VIDSNRKKRSDLYEKEYERIINASNALKKGEISGDNFNQINDEALSNVDDIISEYKHK